MKQKWAVLFLGLCSFFLFTGTANTADVNNPILKKLVEKGILTQQEAISVMQDMSKSTPADEKNVEKIAKDVEDVKKDLGIFKGLSIGVKGYFEYRSGTGADNAGSGIDRNTFRLTRAYLDVKKQLTGDLMVRWTSDYETKAAQTDANVFMKYLYLEYKLPFNAAITGGVTPAPYIGYYEDFWPYRMIGKIPQERFKVLDASADIGVLLGGKFKIANADMVSYALGVFNNQHYRVNDNNKDKSIEGRLTVRPLAAAGVDLLKGLELTYFGIRGEDGAEADQGTANYGKHKNDTFFAGYSYAGLAIGYEYYQTTRFGGTKTANSTIYNKSMDGKNPGTANNLYFDNATGQTLLATYRLPNSLKPVRLFGEYAMFEDIKVGSATNPKTGNITSTLLGASYDIYKDKTVLVLDYNNVKYKNIGTAADDKIFQIVVQIAY
jgi:hypothetical protein